MFFQQIGKLFTTIILYSFLFLYFYFFGCIASSLRHTGSSLRHAGPFGAACRLLPSCGVRVFWFFFLFSSCGVQAPGCVGSVVVVHRLSRLTACRILVPQPGIEPTSPALEGGFFTSGPPGKSPFYILETVRKE